MQGAGVEGLLLLLGLCRVGACCGDLLNGPVHHLAACPLCVHRRARSEMRGAGIEGLSLLQGLCGNPTGADSGLEAFIAAERISRFSYTFTDQHGWIRRLAAAEQVEHAGELFTKLRYVHAPELFSMYACLYLCKVVENNGHALAGHGQRCATLVAEYTQQHGQPPHPAVLWELANRDHP
jgi:hypothetical protein